MLERIPQGSDAQRSQGLREVMQEIALAGLYRRGFFGKAAFYGGTCLRIFHQLPRFSEDLDFSLLQPDSEFSLQPYLLCLEEEFAALGIDVAVSVKTNTTIVELASDGNRMVKMKLEVDTDPLAGKVHAVVCRQWQQRVKGRDWFDLEWYVRQGIPLHLEHLAERARQSGDWPHDQPFTAATLQTLLTERIARLDVANARVDIERFIADPQPLAIWSAEYFQQLGRRIKLREEIAAQNGSSRLR